MIADKIRCCVCVYVRVCVYFRPRMSVKEAKGVNWRVCECEWMKESRNKEWARIWHRMVFDGIFVPFPFYLYVGEKRKTILMANQKIYPSLINIEINTTKTKLVAWKRRKNAIRTKTTSGPIYKPVSHNVLFSCVLFFFLWSLNYCNERSHVYLSISLRV